MEIINSLSGFSNNFGGTAVTIGSFDGVHKGHQFLLDQLKKEAHSNKLKSLVITFEPHPLVFFQPDNKNILLLNTLDEKIDLLKKQGIDFLIIQKFDRFFANQSPEHFIERLSKNVSMKVLLLGHDHHFGKDRSGTFEYIRSLEKKYDFKSVKVPAYQINDMTLSSTNVRNELLNGNIKLANQYLGYPFFITGKVIRGSQLGRKLGFPTANISISTPYKLIPKQGVYLVRSKIDKKAVYGMMNIGFRPTIKGKSQTKEVYFFDFNKDLYEKELRIEFLERMRDEQIFPSLEALKEQLKKDEQNAHQLIKKL